MADISHYSKLFGSCACVRCHCIGLASCRTYLHVRHSQQWKRVTYRLEVQPSSDRDRTVLIVQYSSVKYPIREKTADINSTVSDRPKFLVLATSDIFTPWYFPIRSTLFHSVDYIHVHGCAPWIRESGGSLEIRRVEFY